MLGKWSGRFVLVLLLVLTGAGAFVSWELNYKAIKGESRGSAFISDVCKASGGEENACTAVANSRWGSIKILDPDVSGVARALPTAYLGAAYFGMLFLWFLFVGRPNRAGRAWHLLPILLTVIGLVVSCGLWYVMATQLSATCPWCVVIHVINLVVFVGTVLLWPKREAVTPASVPQDAPEASGADGVDAAAAHVETPSSIAAYPSVRLGLGVLFLAFAVSGAGYFYTMDRRMAAQTLAWIKGYNRLMDNPKVLAALDEGEDKIEIPIRDDDPYLGPWDAPHTLTIFTDFECPSCAQLHSKLPKFLSAFRLGNRYLLRAVYKYAALCTDCNPNVDESTHPYACKAARAAEAARVMGGNETFWKMADQLYKNQAAFGKIDFADLAVKIGLDADEFRKVMESKAVYERVDEDIALGKTAKSHVQTPTLYRDGRRWRMWTTPQAWNDWRDRIKDEARAKATQSNAPPARPPVSVKPNL